jgi:hypothetical protein
MKLLVSNRTKTLVPTNASGLVSRPGAPAAASRGASTSGLVLPSSSTATGGLAPSAKVETLCRIPSSRMRKSLGFIPLM